MVTSRLLKSSPTSPKIRRHSQEDSLTSPCGGVGDMSSQVETLDGLLFFYTWVSSRRSWSFHSDTTEGYNSIFAFTLGPVWCRCPGEPTRAVKSNNNTVSGWRGNHDGLMSSCSGRLLGASLAPRSSSREADRLCKPSFTAHGERNKGAGATHTAGGKLIRAQAGSTTTHSQPQTPVGPSATA